MRIIVISDTHIGQGAKNGLPKKLQDELRSADFVLHAGDITSLEFYQKLKNLAANIKAVQGNMDDAPLKEMLAVKELIRIGKFKIGLMHGWGAPNGLLALAEAEFKKEKPDCIIFGHSHNPVNITKKGILFFNPGSPTDEVFSTTNTYGILTINDTITAEIVKV